MLRPCQFTTLLLGALLCVVPLTAQAGVLITIDKAAQQMTVEIDGTTRWIWPVSTGRRGYETPGGSFRPFRLEEDHYSKEWDEAPMPYSIFFTGTGHAIHGSYETRRLGRPASHGCVRLAPKNAARLFALVKREGLSNARVVVLNDPNAPIMAKRRVPSRETPKVLQARKAPIPAPAATAPIAEATAYAVAPDQTFGYVPAQPIAAPPLAAEPQPAVAPSPASAKSPPIAPNLDRWTVSAPVFDAVAPALVDHGAAETQVSD